MSRHQQPPKTGGFPQTSQDGTQLGRNGAYQAGWWVQTERSAHEAWSRLCRRNSTAAALLHQLVASMGHQNAVVVSQDTLAKILSVTDRTIRTALTVLISERWVQVVRIGKGRESAYVVNDRVAWGEARGLLRLSVFSAQVVVDAADQDNATMDNVELRRIPALYPGEQQLPHGPGEPPPSQADLEGFEAELPTRHEPATMAPALPAPSKRGRKRAKKQSTR